MKRSEMIQHIADSLYNLYPSQSSSDIDSRMNLADEMLRVVEKHGMSPPEISRKHTRYEVNLDDLYPQDINGNKLVNEWESE